MSIHFPERQPSVHVGRGNNGLRQEPNVPDTPCDTPTVPATQSGKEEQLISWLAVDHKLLFDIATINPNLKPTVIADNTSSVSGTGYVVGVGGVEDTSETQTSGDDNIDPLQIHGMWEPYRDILYGMNCPDEAFNAIQKAMEEAIISNIKGETNIDLDSLFKELCSKLGEFDTNDDSLPFDKIDDISEIEKNHKVVIDYIKETYPNLFESGILNDEFCEKIVSNALLFTVLNINKTDLNELTLFKNAIKVQIKLTVMASYLNIDKENYINNNFADCMQAQCESETTDVSGTSRASRRTGASDPVNSIPDSIINYLKSKAPNGNINIEYDDKNSSNTEKYFNVTLDGSPYCILSWDSSGYFVTVKDNEYMSTSVTFDNIGSLQNQKTFLELFGKEIPTSSTDSVSSVLLKFLNDSNYSDVLKFLGNTTALDSRPAGVTSFYSLCALLCNNTDEITDLIIKVLEEKGYDDLMALLNNGSVENNIEHVLSIALFAYVRSERSNTDNFVWNPNGVLYDTTTNQGGVGNCWFLAGNIASSKHQEFLDILSSSVISFNKENQTYTVKIQGKEYTYTFEQLKNATELSNGDPEVRALEMAAREYFNSIGGSNPIANGGSLSKLTEFFTGKDLTKTYDVNEAWIDEIMTHIKSGEYISNVSSMNKGIKLTDAKTGEEVDFINQHAYAVVGCDDEYVYLVNPHDSSRMFKIDRETFKNSGFVYQEVSVSDLVDGIEIGNYDTIHKKCYDFKPDKKIDKIEGNTIKYKDGSYDILDENKISRYNSDGKLISSTEYLENGDIIETKTYGSGMTKNYKNKNGDIYKTEEYSNGEIEECTEFYSNGNCRTITNYFGKNNYRKTYYNPDGKAYKIETCENGKITVREIGNNPGTQGTGGNPGTQGTDNNNNPNNAQNPNQPEDTNNDKNDYKGTTVENHPDGSRTETKYLGDKDNYEKKYYDKGGRLQKEEYVQDGHLSRSIEYNEDGSYTRTDYRDENNYSKKYLDKYGNLTKIERCKNGKITVEDLTKPANTNPPNNNPGSQGSQVTDGSPAGQGAGEDNPDGNGGLIDSGSEDISSLFNNQTTTLRHGGEGNSDDTVTSPLTDEERNTIIQNAIADKYNELREKYGKDVNINVSVDSNGQLSWNVYKGNNYNIVINYIKGLIDTLINNGSYLLSSTNDGGAGGDGGLGALYDILMKLQNGEYINNYQKLYADIAKIGVSGITGINTQTDAEGNTQIIITTNNGVEVYSLPGSSTATGNTDDVEDFDTTSRIAHHVNDSELGSGYIISIDIAEQFAQVISKFTGIPADQLQKLADAIRSGFVPDDLLELLEDENLKDIFETFINGDVPLISDDPDKNFNGFVLQGGGAAKLEQYARTLLELGFFRDIQSARDAICEYLGINTGIGLYDFLGDEVLTMMADMINNDMLGIGGLEKLAKIAYENAEYYKKIGDMDKYEMYIQEAGNTIKFIEKYNMVQELSQMLYGSIAKAITVFDGSDNVGVIVDYQNIYKYVYDMIDRDYAAGYNSYQIHLRAADRFANIDNLKDLLNGEEGVDADDILGLLGRIENDDINSYNWLNMQDLFAGIDYNSYDNQQHRYTNQEKVSYIESLQWRIKCLYEDMGNNQRRHTEYFNGWLCGSGDASEEDYIKAIEELENELNRIQAELNSYRDEYYGAVIYYGVNSEEAAKALRRYLDKLEYYNSPDSNIARNTTVFYYA